jgi:type I restriction-modification system DNA methylase subunit
MLDARLSLLQERLHELEANPNLDAARGVARALVGLLVPGSDDFKLKLFLDGDNKITANSSWFFHDEMNQDRLATYTMDVPKEFNLDVKVFGLPKPNQRTISWVVGLTPNFEDEPFNSKFNVGIDLVIPKSLDRVIVALSNNYVVRTLELRGTLTSTFLNILSTWGRVKSFDNKTELHKILWDSFDLHPINTQFYEEISQRFIALRQHLETLGVLDKTHAAQFANRLIGRVIFTWFLDKKGLINQGFDYFESNSFAEDTFYYREKLEPLFFEVLNTPIGERNWPDVLTPYLNGGLFESKPGDLYKNPSLSFPKNYFDDFFKFLRGYNFTTDESTTEFQQVAIDPEMLGRIFENLLAEVSDETGDQARKAKGAFYTPREIVDHMCRESLKSYLRTKVNDDDNFELRLSQLIEATEREFQDQDHNWRRDLKPYKEILLNALDGVKVFDPACGSGAFPIGMMQLLVKVYSRLEPRFDLEKAKLSIVEKNIYGADIEPMAVEIARLRAWLALVVNEGESAAKVKPLPNLDFKFVCANTLIPLEPIGQMAFFEDYDLETQLQEVREKYFKTQSQKQKNALRMQYQKIVDQGVTLFSESTRTSQLRSYRPFESDSIANFFDAKSMFGFGKFDVIVGNPPYVRQEKISYKQSLSGYEVYQSTADLYTYFYELAMNLLPDGGVCTYITSSKFGRALYGKNLRGMLAKQVKLEHVVDFGSKHMFNAVTNTWVVQFKKTQTEAGHDVPVFFGINGTKILVRQSSLSSDSWAFTDETISEVLEKIRTNGIPLVELDYRISYGLKTGCNEGFVIGEPQMRELIGKQAKNKEVLRPLLRGRDIGKYVIQTPTTWIVATKNGMDIEKDFPSIADFLRLKNHELEDRLVKRGDQGSHWMNLRDCAYYQEMEGPKIVWLELSDENKFAYSTAGEYILAGAWMITGPNLLPLLGILNSKVVRFYFSYISNSSGMGTTQWKKFAVERIPIPDFENLDKALVERLTDLVSRRLAIGDGEPNLASEKLDEAIEECALEAYRLTEAESVHFGTTKSSG